MTTLKFLHTQIDKKDYKDKFIYKTDSYIVCEFNRKNPSPTTSLNKYSMLSPNQTCIDYLKDYLY